MSNKFIELNVNHDNFEPAFDEAEMRLRIHFASSSAALSTLMERRFFGTSHAPLHPIDSSAESEVNEDEKTQLNVGGLVDRKYIDGVRLCCTRGFPSSSQLALLEILASSC